MERTVIKAYKYKIRTNKRFVAACERTLDDARFVYNCALEHRIRVYEQSGRCVGWAEQLRGLTEARKELPEVGKVLRAIQTDAIERLDNAFKLFFTRKGAGYPRFKGRDRYRTFSQKLEPSRVCPLKGDKLTVPGVGSCRVRLSRKLPENSRVKMLRITRHVTGWYAFLVVESPLADPLPKTGERVGIDVGIKEFAVLSNGECIANPHHLRRASYRLAKYQRRLSRKCKGSQNRQKAKRRIAIAYARVVNSRTDFHHKTAKAIVDRFDSIAVEHLNIQGLVRNRKLSAAILDAAWASFFSITQRKAENAGREFVKVAPAYTSQTCSACGSRQKMPLRIRIFVCERCGFVGDRDHNAAINIKTTAELAGSNACRDQPARVSMKQERALPKKKRCEAKSVPGSLTYYHLPLM